MRGLLSGSLGLIECTLYQFPLWCSLHHLDLLRLWDFTLCSLSALLPLIALSFLCWVIACTFLMYVDTSVTQTGNRVFRLWIRVLLYLLILLSLHSKNFSFQSLTPYSLILLLRNGHHVSFSIKYTLILPHLTFE